MNVNVLSLSHTKGDKPPFYKINKMKISKNYVGYPSKSIADYESGLTLDAAKESLNHIQRNWIRLGGCIVNKTDDCLVVEEANGESMIEFSIEEELIYDVHFNSNESSDNEGFKYSFDYCKNYIEMWNGTNRSYFEDYKGGTVSIVKNGDETVYEEEVK